MPQCAKEVAHEVKNPPANAGDSRGAGLIPGSGRSPEEGHGNPLQYSRLENPMDREVWWAIAHRVAKSWTRLEQLSIQHVLKTRRNHRSECSYLI